MKSEKNKNSIHQKLNWNEKKNYANPQYSLYNEFKSNIVNNWKLHH